MECPNCGSKNIFKRNDLYYNKKTSVDVFGTIPDKKKYLPKYMCTDCGCYFSIIVNKKNY